MSWIRRATHQRACGPLRVVVVLLGAYAAALPHARASRGRRSLVRRVDTIVTLPHTRAWPTKVEVEVEVVTATRLTASIVAPCTRPATRPMAHHPRLGAAVRRVVAAFYHVRSEAVVVVEEEVVVVASRTTIPLTRHDAAQGLVQITRTTLPTASAQASPHHHTVRMRLWGHTGRVPHPLLVRILA